MTGLPGPVTVQPNLVDAAPHVALVRHQLLTSEWPH